MPNFATVERFGKRGTPLRLPANMVSRESTEALVKKHFRRSPDGYLRINRRYAFTLSQALSHLSKL